MMPNQLVNPPMTFISPMPYLQNPIVASELAKPTQIGNKFLQPQVVVKEVSSPMENQLIELTKQLGELQVNLISQNIRKEKSA